jgi:hypothetical protein
MPRGCSAAFCREGGMRARNSQQPRVARFTHGPHPLDVTARLVLSELFRSPRAPMHRLRVASVVRTQRTCQQHARVHSASTMQPGNIQEREHTATHRSLATGVRTAGWR